MAVDAQVLLLVVAAGALPPILYLVLIRNVERTEREPFGRLFAVFLYGAIVSVIIALALQLIFHTGLEREYDLAGGTGFTVPALVILAVVVAPLTEEFTKGLAVRVGRSHITEIEDGIVYGAAAGLGFSASENVLYELTALFEEGAETALLLVALRSVTSTFLHATATGLVGYGLARVYLERRNFIEVVPYYALAVLLHAAFNLIALLQFYGGVLLILVISFFSIRWTVHRIRHFDRTSVPTFQVDR